LQLEVTRNPKILSLAGVGQLEGNGHVIMMDSDERSEVLESKQSGPNGTIDSIRFYRKRCCQKSGRCLEFFAPDSSVFPVRRNRVDGGMEAGMREDSCYPIPEPICSMWTF